MTNNKAQRSLNLIEIKQTIKLTSGLNLIIKSKMDFRNKLKIDVKYEVNF